MTDPVRLQQLLSLLDVTRLTETDDAEQLANWLGSLPPETSKVAAFCVYAPFIGLTKAFVRDRQFQIAIATVVNFPKGDQALSQVQADIVSAITAGAFEIDCVLPYKQLLAGHEQHVRQFLDAVRAASAGVCLKVIIESGELVTAQQITKATELAIACGADFVKTSTGKVPIGVTLEAARIIMTSIAASDRAVGFKASGGVKTVAQALELVDLYETITGKTATPALMRIGASSLLTELSQQLAE